MTEFSSTQCPPISTVHILPLALLSQQARSPFSMGAAFPCFGRNKRPRAPPPMAKPPAPDLNACIPDDLNRGNDRRQHYIPNPWPYLGHPKAPPPHLYRAPYGYAPPVKAPPPHLAGLPGIAVRRELAPPPIKAPPAHVFNAREQLLDVAVIKAPPAHVFNARE